MNFYVTCPKGFEQLVETEVKNLRCYDSDSYTIKIGNGGITVDADHQFIYHFSLATRVATRILLMVADEPCQSREDVYRISRAVPWLQHFQKEHIERTGFTVDFSGKNDAIRHTQFGAQVIKDGIVDQLREFTEQRPFVDTKDPDLRIAGRLAKGRLTIAVDLSGHSLHQRGYRLEAGDAPVKEHIASAILARAKALEGSQLVDPMCGSGTFCIEFALLKLGVSPRLSRAEYGFKQWKQFNSDQFLGIYDSYKEQFDHALKVAEGAGNVLAFGSDADARVVSAARANAERAKIGSLLRFETQDIGQYQRPDFIDSKAGLLVCNPPYGTRLGERSQLPTLYQALSKLAKSTFAGWRGAILAGDKDLADSLRMGGAKTYRFLNGSIESTLVVFAIKDQSESRLKPVHTRLADNELSQTAQGLYNRLKKNLRTRKSWAKREKVSAFRLYDADIPEYASAIDLYYDMSDTLHIHLQEYAAPKTIDPGKAKRRLQETAVAVAKLFDLDADGEQRLIIKEREQKSGRDQYELTGNEAEPFEVREGRATLIVDLKSRLDTGLFLDHRPLRLQIAKHFESMRGGAFLNLFCYTATATVHAALAGAERSVSVDTSNTYLNWAKDNYAQNALNPYRHVLERKDVWEYLSGCREGFDLIMLDPPTFSNNRSTGRVFDVEQDHPQYILRCLELLLPGGVLYFSTNKKRFKPAPELDRLPADMRIEEVSAKTIDIDFKRPSPIHRTWKISRES